MKGKGTNTVAGRLRGARAARGMSQSAVAKYLKVTRGAVGQWETGVTEPTRENLQKLASLLNAPYEWLATGKGKGPSPPGATSGVAATYVLSDNAGPERVSGSVIQELDVRAGMGGGGFLESQVRQDGQHVDAVKDEAWSFPSSFTGGVLHVPASRLVLIEVQGESMMPTIASGERVVVDTGHKIPSPDGVYAIRDRFDMVVVKRLQAMRDAPKIKVISDNPAHQDEIVGHDEITIVGRVVCGLKLF